MRPRWSASRDLGLCLTSLGLESVRARRQWRAPRRLRGHPDSMPSSERHEVAGRTGIPVPDQRPVKGAKPGPVPGQSGLYAGSGGTPVKQRFLFCAIALLQFACSEKAPDEPAAVEPLDLDVYLEMDYRMDSEAPNDYSVIAVTGEGGIKSVYHWTGAVVIIPTPGPPPRGWFEPGGFFWEVPWIAGDSCSNHGQATVLDTVPIRYGLPILDREYESARERFPNSWSSMQRGCVITSKSPVMAIVRYCPSCRDAERKWLDAHRAGH